MALTAATADEVLNEATRSAFDTKRTKRAELTMSIDGGEPGDGRDLLEPTRMVHSGPFTQ
jgi:hypothetical protein